MDHLSNKENSSYSVMITWLEGDDREFRKHLEILKMINWFSLESGDDTNWWQSEATQGLGCHSQLV